MRCRWVIPSPNSVVFKAAISVSATCRSVPMRRNRVAPIQTYYSNRCLGLREAGRYDSRFCPTRFRFPRSTGQRSRLPRGCIGRKTHYARSPGLAVGRRREYFHEGACEHRSRAGRTPRCAGDRLPQRSGQFGNGFSALALVGRANRMIRSPPLLTAYLSNRAKRKAVQTGTAPNRLPHRPSCRFRICV